LRLWCQPLQSYDTKDQTPQIATKANKKMHPTKWGFLSDCCVLRLRLVGLGLLRS